MLSLMILVLILGLGLIVLRLEKISGDITALAGDPESALSNDQLVKLFFGSRSFKDDFTDFKKQSPESRMVDFIAQNRGNPDFILRYTTKANLKRELEGNSYGIAFIAIGCVIWLIMELAIGTLFNSLRSIM